MTENLDVILKHSNYPFLPCPICNGIEGCDHTVPERYAAFIKEPEHIATDGSVRKDHYGMGRQPWDDIVDAHWGPAFAAGNALKYIRRYKMKNGDDDLAKGRWYFDQLNRLGINAPRHEHDGILERLTRDHAISVMNKLETLITREELSLLQDGLTVVE